MNLCDCGQVATKRDGSGWFCQECERVVKMAQQELSGYILRRRVEEYAPTRTDRISRYAKTYYSKNRQRLLEYKKQYDRRVSHA